MVNFRPLAAEIGPVVWGTPANFNRFRVLAALLHATPVLGVSKTAALNIGRHLYSAGRPSRWALAHILVYKDFGSCVRDYTQVYMSTRRSGLVGSGWVGSFIMVALWNRADHYIFIMFLSSFFFFLA